MPVKFLAASVRGADGCDDRLDGLGLGALGGGTVPPPPPLEPAEASIAGVAEPPADPAAPLEPAAPPADRRPVAPAAAPSALSPIDPTAMAPPATKAPLATRSPPERAGEPPNTAANSLGICQQSIMKMIEAPMISSADMAGLALAAIFWASVIQSTERFIPVPIKR